MLKPESRVPGQPLQLARLVILLAAAAAAAAQIRFQDATSSSGIHFTLENSPTATKHLPETMAGGVAAFDYDGDGLIDIFFTNGAEMPSLQKTGPRFHNRLFRNLGGFKFTDVTAQAGVAGAGYSVAAAAADFDNDGHVDLFVASVRANILYRNRGDGTFEDVTSKAGITSSEWAEGAAWLDFDNDGLLDLFVVNYVDWQPSFQPFCGDEKRGIRSYCHPRLFKGTANRLYRNLGAGRFADVTESSGLATSIGKGMAAAVADYDGDGRPDIFVTNDKLPNFLFHNLGNGRFAETSFDAGTALVDSGTEMSAMGAEFRDLDNDGRPDIALTALAGETFPFFRNLGGGRFADAGIRWGTAPLTRAYSGWGIGAFDFDNDGCKDIFTANSHVDDRVDAFEATTYRQRNSLFRGACGGRFVDISEAAGSEFVSSVRAHRGCAFADFDGDGRVDVVVTSLGDRPELWRNVTATAPENSWLIVKLTGVRSNRDGLGAVVRVGTQVNHMTSSVGYASSSLWGVHFGLGQAKAIDTVEILWPSGTRQTLHNVRVNQVLEVREPGQGEERKRR
jgi:hypothetical protein